MPVNHAVDCVTLVPGCLCLALVQEYKAGALRSKVAMGRRKIEIKKVESLRSRNATFKKRRVGILKKALELAVLTDREVTLSIKNGAEVESHVFNGLDLPPSPRNSLPPVASDNAAVALSTDMYDMYDTPQLDSHIVDETTVACRTPAIEAALVWPAQPDFDYAIPTLDPVLDPIALSVAQELVSFDPDFNGGPSSLDVFGYPLLGGSLGGFDAPFGDTTGNNWLLPWPELIPAY